MTPLTQPTARCGADLPLRCCSHVYTHLVIYGRICCRWLDVGGLDPLLPVYPVCLVLRWWTQPVVSSYGGLIRYYGRYGCRCTLHVDVYSPVTLPHVGLRFVLRLRCMRYSPVAGFYGCTGRSRVDSPVAGWTVTLVFDFTIYGYCTRLVTLRTLRLLPYTGLDDHAVTFATFPVTLV